MGTEFTKILVVDDEEPLCAMVRKFLRRLGYDCQTTRDPLDALEILQKIDCTLVISDITMPTMSGLELLGKIHERNSDIDVILMTGYTKDHTYSDIIKYGAAVFLGKPFALPELKAKVERIGRERKILCELKRASSSLQLALNTQRAITESARDAIVMMNPEGHISYWNPAAESILGYTKEEAIGRNLHALIVPQRFHAAHRAAFPEFLATGRGGAVGKTLEVVARRKDGREIPVELSLSSFYMDGWQGVGLLQDITERKQAEEKLNEMNTELERQTRVAKEMASQARAANLAKSEFLANMSHEIRTPLNGVVGMAGLLLDTELSEEQRRYAQMLRAGGETLLGLINDILDFSKIEARKLDLEIIDFDLSNLLEDFACSMAVTARDKGLQLLCNSDSRVPSLLRGDPGRLGQILTNLVGNAIKFTPSGKVEIFVSLESDCEHTAILRFVVRDTGIGIPENKIDLLFEKFSQVDASTTREYGGTGLGLSITKQLVELMEGRIGVKSKYGRGAEFWFTIPLGKQPRAVPAGQGGKTEEPVARVDLSGLFSDRKLRVLLAEDNPTNQQVALGILKKLGISADAVANGAEAIAALESIPYDLVLMDVQMPELDGLEATRAIRGMQSRIRNLPIVALTARAVAGDSEKCLNAGMNDYITKPVNPAILAAVLQKWLPGAPDSDPAVWDREGMLHRLMYETELAEKVLDGFLIDIPKQIGELRRHIENEDCASAERRAHSIKGACANVGGEKMSQVALEMERAANAGDFAAVGAIMTKLKSNFRCLEKAIKARTKQL